MARVIKLSPTVKPARQQQSRSTRGFTLIEVMITVAILLIVAVSFFAPYYQCGAKWGRSGMASEWGFIQGCMVEVEPGRWIPDERVREIDIPRKK